MVPYTPMKRPGFWLLVGIPWLVTLMALGVNLSLHHSDAAYAWTWVALLFTVLTGALPGCLKYTQNRSKRIWLHIVVGDVSLVATAVATALASDEGLVTMWIAICANALSAVGSHLVFVFWDDGREMRREKRSMTDENGEAPKTNRISLRGILLIALFLFWVLLYRWHPGFVVYACATLFYALIVVGIYWKKLDSGNTYWRALKVTLLGVSVLASSYSVGLGRVDDNDTRLALDWTSFVAIQLLAILAHMAPINKGMGPSLRDIFLQQSLLSYRAL